MMFPPSLLRLRIRNEGIRFGLWIPLVLIWPIVLLLGILLSPVIIALSIILWPWGWGKILLFGGPWLFKVFCALRGLTVTVEQPTEEVIVFFR